MSNKKSQNRTANRMTSPHYMVMDESEDDEEQQQNNKKDMKEFMIDTANKFLTFIVRYDTEPKTVADEIETIITGISPLERERRVKLCNEYREIRSSLTAEFGTEDTEKFVELTEERMNRMASFLTFVDLRSRNDPEEISLADDEAKFYMTSSCNRHARAYNLGPFTLTQKEQGECCNEDCYKKTTYYIGGTIMKLYHSDVCKNRRDAMLDAAIAKSVEIGTYFETPMRSYSPYKECGCYNTTYIYPRKGISDGAGRITIQTRHDGCDAQHDVPDAEWNQVDTFNRIYDIQENIFLKPNQHHTKQLYPRPVWN